MKSLIRIIAINELYQIIQEVQKGVMGQFISQSIYFLSKYLFGKLFKKYNQVSIWDQIPQSYLLLY